MIEEQISRAISLYERHGQALTNQNGLDALFETYRNAIEKTKDVMTQLRVVETCSECSRKASGSCCFQGVEEWYDHFMNLILGRQIPEFREIPGGCLFVGSRGCKLIARHSFCVNYLCPSLKDFIKTPQMRTLLSVSGDELLHGWELERKVRKQLKELDPGPYKTSGRK